MAFYPFTLEDESVQDRTYVTYLINGKFGDLELPRHEEDPQELIEAILDHERSLVKNELLGSYTVEL